MGEEKSNYVLRAKRERERVRGGVGRGGVVLSYELVSHYLY